MHELLHHSTGELAKMVRTGEVRAIEVLEAHIARIERVDSRINAVVARRFETAREEAKAADKKRTRVKNKNALPPLHGIPCTVKDFISVAGLPQTGGLVSRRDVIASEDAPVVARLKKAGAIILGNTNIPEGGLWVESVNKVYGRTRNPWNLGHTSGGSSGGEAAAVASG